MSVKFISHDGFYNWGVKLNPRNEKDMTFLRTVFVDDTFTSTAIDAIIDIDGNEGDVDKKCDFGEWDCDYSGYSHKLCDHTICNGGSNYGDLTWYDHKKNIHYFCPQKIN